MVGIVNENYIVIVYSFIEMHGRFERLFFLVIFNKMQPDLCIGGASFHEIDEGILLKFSLILILEDHFVHPFAFGFSS